MADRCQPGWARNLVALWLIAAVALVPLVHAGQAQAQPAQGQDMSANCCDDGCGDCDCCGVTDDAPCCPGEDEPANAPCDCPCCVKVVPAAPMISPPPSAGLFWSDAPSVLTVTCLACPDSVAVRVDIQPPIA